MNVADLIGLSESKKRERFELERFIESYPAFPAGQRNFGDKPDLIVSTAAGKLGVEHTSLYKDDSQKEHESIRSKIIALAEKEYEESGEPLSYVQVYFDERLPLTNGKSRLIVSELVQAVRNIASMPTSTYAADLVTNFEYERRFGNPLPREVLQIQAKKVRQGDAAGWFAFAGHVASQLNVATVQTRIDQKHNKLADYKRNCDEVWLLLVSDGLYGFSHFAPSDSLRSHAFNVSFDRAFFFDSLRGDVLPLGKA